MAFLGKLCGWKYITIIASHISYRYYLNTVCKICGCPKLLRGDFGTENIHVVVRDFQRAFRSDGDNINIQRVQISITKGLNVIRSTDILSRRPNIMYYVPTLKKPCLIYAYLSCMLQENLATQQDFTSRNDLHTQLPYSIRNLLQKTDFSNLSLAIKRESIRSLL